MQYLLQYIALILKLTHTHKKKTPPIFYSKSSRKYLAIVLKYMEDGENKISFIKDVEIRDGKTDAIYSVLRVETEKMCWNEGLSRFGNNGASVKIGHSSADSVGVRIISVGAEPPQKF